MVFFDEQDCRDPLQVRFACFRVDGVFQKIAGTPDNRANIGIMVFDEIVVLVKEPDSFLLWTRQAFITTLQNDMDIIENVKLRPQSSDTPILLVFRRKRITDNLPHFRFGDRIWRIPLNILEA